MQDYTTEEQPIYVRFVKRHYGALVHLLWYVATETSDRGADIAARALALLAPLPNAVSVYNVSQHSLNYTPLQAFAFAMAIELALFAIIEVALHMWDGWLSNARRYIAPLVISVIASVGVLIIVMTVVYQLEVKTGGHWVLAGLPLISLFAFVALGLKRWHERNAQPTMHKRTVHKAKSTVHKAKSTVQPAVQSEDAPAIDKRQRALQLKSEGLNNQEIAFQLGVHRNTVGNLLKSTNGHSKEPAQ
jgi:DNA-binding CsgD family transcriptional regulator